MNNIFFNIPEHLFEMAWYKNTLTPSLESRHPKNKNTMNMNNAIMKLKTNNFIIYFVRMFSFHNVYYSSKQNVYIKSRQVDMTKAIASKWIYPFCCMFACFVKSIITLKWKMYDMNIKIIYVCCAFFSLAFSILFSHWNHVPIWKWGWQLGRRRSHFPKRLIKLLNMTITFT